MDAVKLLASSLGRRDDKPNQELAEKIIKSRRTGWVKELVYNLDSADKNIQSDCIKVLYEIGEQGSAKLISPYCADFGRLLANKNNRLVWGAMTALDSAATVDPAGVFRLLPQITAAVEEGSVITVDHGVSILSKLAGIKKYSAKVLPLLLKQLERCPAKQLPMYAEKSVAAVSSLSGGKILSLLQRRYAELENSSQKKRVEKVMAKIRNAAGKY
jgi:hypothetical protein